MFSWHCGAACWAATGSMLQGLGALGAAGAVLYAATNAFPVYRRQKLEERRIAAAERVLTFAYRLADDLSAVCSPVVGAAELKRAAESLNQNGLTSGLLGEHAFSDACKAQALLQRLAERENNWNDFATIQVMARAHFEEQVEKLLKDLWKLRTIITSSAGPHVDPQRATSSDPAQLRDVFEVNIMKGAFHPIFAARLGLENLLLPIIRSEFRRKPYV